MLPGRSFDRFDLWAVIHVFAAVHADKQTGRTLNYSIFWTKCGFCRVLPFIRRVMQRFCPQKNWTWDTCTLGSMRGKKSCGCFLVSAIQTTKFEMWNPKFGVIHKGTVVKLFDPHLVFWCFTPCIRLPSNQMCMGAFNPHSSRRTNHKQGELCSYRLSILLQLSPATVRCCTTKHLPPVEHLGKMPCLRALWMLRRTKCFPIISLVQGFLN